MLGLLLLLLVGTTLAQESGDYAQENAEELMMAANEEDDNIAETFDDAYDEEECDDKDPSLRIEPDATVEAEDADCPDKGKCGFHVFSSPRPFLKAQRTCRCRRGNLASIHNCGKNGYLRELVRKTCTNVTYVWIGVWKRRRCSPYRNVDRSSLNYTNWACGQRKSRGRWCTAMNTQTGQWFSFSCRTRLPFVCSY